jgi:hypothetical protein
MLEQGRHPAALYKGIPIYLSQQEGMGLGEYAAHIECYGRLMLIEIQDGHYPTRTNLLKAAATVIDVLLNTDESEWALELESDL